MTKPPTAVGRTPYSDAVNPLQPSALRVLRDSKNTPPGSAYGRPASLKEHERLVRSIVEWATYFVKGLDTYRRNRTSTKTSDDRETT